MAKGKILMLVVLDTNILLVSLKSHTKYSCIFENLVNEKFELAISNEILFEYFEIIASKTTELNARYVINLLISLPNVKQIEPYFKWNLITKDESDNKFTDVAISANADFIVTEDKDFNDVKKLEFPKINIIDINQFIELLFSQSH